MRASKTNSRPPLIFVKSSDTSADPSPLSLAVASGAEPGQGVTEHSSGNHHIGELGIPPPAVASGAELERETSAPNPRRLRPVLEKEQGRTLSQDLGGKRPFSSAELVRKSSGKELYDKYKAHKGPVLLTRAEVPLLIANSDKKVPGKTDHGLQTLDQSNLSKLGSSSAAGMVRRTLNQEDSPPVIQKSSQDADTPQAGFAPDEGHPWNLLSRDYWLEVLPSRPGFKGVPERLLQQMLPGSFMVRTETLYPTEPFILSLFAGQDDSSSFKSIHEEHSFGCTTPVVEMDTCRFSAGFLFAFPFEIWNPGPPHSGLFRVRASLPPPFLGVFPPWGT